ncbi:MAG: POTRA domain-containing protein, partial [Desulfuromonadaceae bacterium]|nr:POTRA domain-containing protein [Desulfuromonadaceae bacterium]
MSDPRPLSKHSYSRPQFLTIYAALACLFLSFSSAMPLHAADPVGIVITGIEGDALKNVKEALVLPVGLVREGKVDRLWLDRFAKQADAKTRSALEPFGFYNSLVSVSVEPVGENYRLLVKVAPGEPVRLAGVEVTLAGPGNGEKRLRRQIATFPLKEGDVLLHQRYEEAKSVLKLRAQELGYLDAEFSR